MPIQWSVSSSLQIVLASARGIVTAGDLEAYLRSVFAAGAGPYPKLFTIYADTVLPSATEIATAAGVMRQVARDPIGPVAIVALSDAAIEAARAFAGAVSAKRPLRVFTEINEASAWLKSMPTLVPDADSRTKSSG